MPAGRGPSDGVRELLLREEEEQAPDDEPEPVVLEEEEEVRLLRRDERRRRLRETLPLTILFSIEKIAQSSERIVKR